MGFYVSPGVFTREIDLSDIVPNVATSIMALVGAPNRGNIDEPVLITNLEQFYREYGEPVVGNYFGYAGLGYLTHGQQLQAMRVVNGALVGGLEIKEAGSSQDNAAFVVGEADPTTHSFGLDGLLAIFAKDPGVWNNGLKIILDNIDTTEHTFDISVFEVNVDNVDVLKEKFTGCSRQTKLDGFGIQAFVEERVNEFSNYIRVLDNTAEVDTIDPKEQATALAMAGGTNGAAVTDGIVNIGWDQFANPEVININLLVSGVAPTVAISNKMIALAESRLDSIALLDIPLTDNTVTEMTTYRSTTLNANTSYAALYSHWIKIFDQWNDQVVTIPSTGFVAGQFAFNDFIRDPWFAAAGFNRGRLNVQGVNVVFSEGDRNTLYPVQINPIQSFKGEGIVIWGTRTLQVKQSALSQISIRRMLITIEKSVSTALKFFVFEPNDDATRLRITSMVEEFLEVVLQRRGLEEFSVVCDETNNTPAVRERGELLVDVFIKPVFPAEFIQLSMIITRLGASFEETLALGA